MRSYLLLACFFVLWLGCGPGVVETGNPANVYVTSSDVGDLGTWTVNANSSFEMQWLVTAPDSGTVRYSYNSAGTCGATGSFGFRECTLATATCTPAANACPPNAPVPGDAYQMLEMPGVALFAYSASQNQLHVGIVKGDCTSDISGDYTFINTGLGRREVFGMYRLDATFSDIVHSNFGFRPIGAPSLYHYTLDGGGTGAISHGGATSCADGVRTINYGGALSRATLTTSGLFVYDFPSLLGGAFAFRKDLAASIGDLAGKSLTGFVLSSSGVHTMARLVLGAQSGSHIPYNSLIYRSGTQPSVPGAYLESAKDAGGSYGFNGNPPGLAASYSSNLLAGDYPTPSDIPGVFLNPIGSSVNNFVIVTAMKNAVNGKLLYFAAEVDNRTGIKIVSISAFMEN